MEIEESSYFLFYTLQMLENFASDHLDNSILFCKKKKNEQKRLFSHCPHNSSRE